MPIHVHRFPGSRASIVMCEGQLTPADLAEVVDHYRGTGHFEAFPTAVVDLSPLTDIDLSFREIQRLVAPLQQSLGATGRALRIEVVAPDAGQRTAARVFKIVAAGAQGLEVALHDRLADAVRAAGIGPAELADFVGLP